MYVLSFVVIGGLVDIISEDILPPKFKLDQTKYRVQSLLPRQTILNETKSVILNKIIGNSRSQIVGSPNEGE